MFQYIELTTCEQIAALAERPIDSTIQMVQLFFNSSTLDAKAVASIVAFLCDNQYRIHELAFTNCTGDIGTVISVALATCKRLETLSIFVGNSRASAFDQFAHSLGAGLIITSSLLQLSLGIIGFVNYFTLSSGAAKSLQQGLSGNKSLKSLYLRNCRFEERTTVRILAEGLESMTSLNLVDFVSFYEPNGQPLEDHGVARLIRALENNSNLQILSLSESKCLDEGMIALSALLDRTPMQRLHLCCQKMDENEFLNTFHLVGALGRTTTLEILNLESNHLSTDYDMANLAAALTHNTSIKLLDITGNNIRSSAMTILASRIPLMKVLKTLLIGCEDLRFDEETSHNLARAMKENLSITEIMCDPGLADYTAIEYYTDLNWGGRRFIEQNKGDNTAEKISPIPLSLWPKILSMVTRRSEETKRQANLIYYYLQKGSVIFPV